MKLILAMTILLLSLAACFALPVEDPIPASPVAPMPAARTVRTATAMRGDVIRYANTIVFLVPTREERLFFQEGGLLVAGIFAEAGHQVMPGDIIATLYNPAITEVYDAAILREEDILLALNHAQRRRTHTRNQAAAQGVAPNVAAYTSAISRYERELELVQLEIEFFRARSEELHVRASMEGIVTEIITFQEGMRSGENSFVGTISDLTVSVFELRSSDVAPFLQVGDLFTVMANQVPYEAVVIDPDYLGIDRAHLHGHEAFLVLLDESAVMPANPSATIRVELDAARDVIFVPTQAVHTGAERYFVYVQNQYGVRAVRNIEVGVRGNTTVEITSGLDAGEVVILE